MSKKKRNRNRKQNQNQNPIAERTLEHSQYTYISVLNVMAAVAVIMMHANVSFWVDKTKPYWDTANVIESVFYFAVPVFFMLTGATLIDYHERYSTKEFFLKRFKKTVIPFIGWSVFSLLWQSRKVLWAMKRANRTVASAGLSST